MRVLRVAGAVLLGLAVATAAPAAAENPVYDAETAADIAAAFAEATEVQGVCYGVVLDVSDPSGQWGGMYVVTSRGVDAPLSPTGCKGVVELRASIAYASEYSEDADTAGWFVESSFGGVSAADLERNDLRASDLLDDGRSEETLLNAALALPRLTAEVDRAVPPIVLTPATASPPADARPTGSPGNDQLREHRALLAVLGLAALGGLAWAVSLVRAARRPAPDHWPRPPYRSAPMPYDTTTDTLPGPEHL